MVSGNGVEIIQQGFGQLRKIIGDLLLDTRIQVGHALQKAGHMGSSTTSSLMRSRLATFG